MTTELQTEQPKVCTLDDLGFKVTGEDAPELIDAMSEYLSVFAAPKKSDDSNLSNGGHLCLKCDSPLNGMLGSFQWGMVNGEGNCSNCGWPARAHHRPKGKDGELILNGTMEAVLQYHPDYVTTKQEAGP